MNIYILEGIEGKNLDSGEKAAIQSFSETVGLG